MVPMHEYWIQKASPMKCVITLWNSVCYLFGNFVTIVLMHVYWENDSSRTRGQALEPYVACGLMIICYNLRSSCSFRVLCFLIPFLNRTLAECRFSSKTGIETLSCLAIFLSKYSTACAWTDFSSNSLCNEELELNRSVPSLPCKKVQPWYPCKTKNHVRIRVKVRSVRRDLESWSLLIPCPPMNCALEGNWSYVSH